MKDKEEKLELLVRLAATDGIRTQGAYRQVALWFEERGTTRSYFYLRKVAGWLKLSDKEVVDFFRLRADNMDKRLLYT